MEESSIVEDHPEYPEDCFELIEECRQDYLLPTHVANVLSRTTYLLTGTEKQALDTAPKYVREVSLAINEVNLEFHEHTNTVRGLKDFLLAQNRDVYILAIKNLVAKESLDSETFPEKVRVFAKNYYKQKIFVAHQCQWGAVRKVSKASTCTAYPPLHDHHATIVPARNSLQGS